MYIADNKTMINENLCIGCAVCAQICPENAILPIKEAGINFQFSIFTGDIYGNKT